MARIDPTPAPWAELPASMAAQLGWTIAGFGHLEDMLKRAVFALDRHQLPAALRERDFRDWLRRMDHVAADSLGTLIDRLDRTLLRDGRPDPDPDPDPDLTGRLDEIKAWRNLLCHAAWRSGPQGWQPIFADTRGELFDGVLSEADLAEIRALTLNAAEQVRRIIESLDADDNGAAD